MWHTRSIIRICVECALYYRRLCLTYQWVWPSLDTCTVHEINVLAHHRALDVLRRKTPQEPHQLRINYNVCLPLHRGWMDGHELCMQCTKAGLHTQLYCAYLGACTCVALSMCRVTLLQLSVHRSTILTVMSMPYFRKHFTKCILHDRESREYKNVK